MMHNAIPDYRIPWFKNINQECDVEFIFTNYKLTQKLYHFDINFQDMSSLKYHILGQNRLFILDVCQIVSRVRDFDFVEFPPIDSLKEFFISILVLIKCKIFHIKTGYFWEKWDAPRNKQPTKRKLINFLINLAAGMIYKQVDVIFAGSQSSREYFINHGVDDKKIVVLPDASETPECEREDLRKKYQIANDQIIILYFGRLLFQKGSHILIEALNKIPHKDKYTLIIAGDGENRELCEKMINKYKLNNVVMCGWVNPSERLNYFNQCDIFVFPGMFYQGRVDVWGLTLVEAIQNGKTVISTTAVGSAKDLIEDGVNGFLLNAGNEDNMIDRLASAIEKYDDNLDAKAKEYNKKLARIYSFKNMTDVYINTIAKICE